MKFELAVEFNSSSSPFFTKVFTMRNELQDLLYARYPNLYRDKDEPMTQTAMCWGFSHGDGWFSIIDALSTTLIAMDPEARARQVKEKFGTLRFYVATNVESVHAVTSVAEGLSARICERTGHPGELISISGWYSTLALDVKVENGERPRRIEPNDDSTDEWPPRSPTLEAKLGFSRDDAIAVLRKRHPLALARIKEIQIPPRLFDLVDVALHRISRPRSKNPDAAVVKIDELYWNSDYGLVIRPSFLSMRSVALEEIEIARQKSLNGREFEEPALADVILDIANETEAVALFANVMSKRMEVQSGRCGPVDDNGKIINLLLELGDRFWNTRDIFAIFNSFDPDDFLAKTILSKRRVKATLKAREDFVRKIKSKDLQIVLPKIYLQESLLRHDKTKPSLWRVTRELAHQYDWRIILPVEMSRFLMGRTPRPDLDKIQTYFYDQPLERRYDKLGLTITPVTDMRLLKLNVAGQAIWQHVNNGSHVSKKNLLEDARFAGSAWFSNTRFFLRLVDEVQSGRLEGRELFLAQAIITAAREKTGVAYEAPPSFNPSEHEASAALVYGWGLAEHKDGLVYLVARKVRNHPYIADGDSLAHSSPLVWYDEELGWARTRSRYYRLMGRRAQ